MLLKPFTNDTGIGGCGYCFKCPGCKDWHCLSVRPNTLPNGAGWVFNGDFERPTFQPSVLSTVTFESGEKEVCHLFVTDGNLIFLGDCTHELAGKTQPMLDFANP
jgi:hypothetical protein